jgi:hypothetical protein
MKTHIYPIEPNLTTSGRRSLILKAFYPQRQASGEITAGDCKRKQGLTGKGVKKL